VCNGAKRARIRFDSLLNHRVTTALRDHGEFYTLDEIMEVVRRISSTKPKCEKLDYVLDFEAFFANLDNKDPITSGIKNMNFANYNIKISANEGALDIRRDSAQL
jgi:hypothetical protein